MQGIEPYYNWRHFYVAAEDPQSPFYEREYSELYYTHAIYNYVIHPQWDDIGSPTLFIKILFADYEKGTCIIELIGEWNDAINNDIMIFKRDIIDALILEGLNKFILIGENILNFHHSDDSYYDEWYDDIADSDGWIALVGFREHVLAEFSAVDIDSYFVVGGTLDILNWRTLEPALFVEQVDSYVQKRLDFA